MVFQLINEDIHIRTITSVINLDTGNIIDADIFFNQNENVIWKYRQKCQEAIKGKRSPYLVCDTCGQLVQISGGRGNNGKITYFKHLKDSDDCPIKTDTKLSRFEILRGKFNGQKEGCLHIKTKELIAQFLEFNRTTKKGISFIEVEKIQKDNRNYLEWKKPDITSKYYDKKIVFEIQLSTTFIDVICDRQHFYKDNQTFILWIFKEFEIEADKQKFTQKDIFYSNNRNAFVLNEEAINLSLKNHNLYLLCHYQRPQLYEEQIIYKWESTYVCINDLIFDDNFKVYYFNVETAEAIIKTEIENRITERQRREALKIQNFEKVRFEQDASAITLQEDFISERDKVRIKEQLNYEMINQPFFKRLRGYDDLSPMQDVFKSDLHEIKSNLRNLFKKGYFPTSADKVFLKNEYTVELSFYKSSNTNSILCFLALAVFYVKLSHNKQHVDLLPKVERVLFAILSIKEKKVIGYNFKTLVEVPNQFIGNGYRAEFTLPILEAISKYYGYDQFIEDQDKKKSLENKIKSLEEKILPLNDEYKEIINLVFKGLIL